MTSSMIETLLEKSALDNGFDLSLGKNGNFLGFASSHCPLKIWLSRVDGGVFSVAFSDKTLAREVMSMGLASNAELPTAASAVINILDLQSLHSLLKRSYQLSRALPNEPLIEFQKRIRNLPQPTEVERIVIQRVGQDIFRERLLLFWDGRCAVTGLAIPELLRASHIKPWSDCSTDAERLDVYNGLLLAPHLDAAFDRGFITFTDDGLLVISKNLGSDGLRTLGIDEKAKCIGLTPGHFKYLAWHRANEFQGI